MSEESITRDQRIDELLEKHYNRDITVGEREELNEYARQVPGLQSIISRLSNKKLVRKDVKYFLKLESKEITKTSWRAKCGHYLWVKYSW
ncbi:MAG: hypothetical protein ABUT20_43180, partial [Bacteroidota bacterium]